MFVDEEGAGKETFGCSYDIEGVSWDVKGKGEVVNVAVDNCLFDEKAWIAVVDVPLAS